MEIRDPIHGSIEVTLAEAAVIDSPFFQRLRGIKQLGFGEFSFPGATHNRFSHSLGALHLAGRVFDQIFQGYPFSSPQVRWRLRQTVRLGALLHDVGHGPLSHTTEEVMPPLSQLKLKLDRPQKERKANHEDYTLKLISDSTLTETLKSEFIDLKPLHVCELVDKDLVSQDDFFVDGGNDLRPILSQIVSSELDVDRMDYLARDSYYCGASYGKVDSDWLIGNLTHFNESGRVYLGLNRRALYTFDDFLISRYHMYLMIYFHHKSVIYDEMLQRYLRSPDCDFHLPSEIEKYIDFDDHRLFSQMRESKNPWAQHISRRQPYRMLLEIHDEGSECLKDEVSVLKKAGIDLIHTSSTGRLSKYYSTGIKPRDPIFVIDKDRGKKVQVSPIEDSSKIFAKYESSRKIERLYVSRDNFTQAQSLIG
ncbi:MAG: HD domain-containing protein [Oligoflexia bacterium]|nr:HD domain-containing protein [Oligoflexia bacterium]